MLIVDFARFGRIVDLAAGEVWDGRRLASEVARRAGLFESLLIKPGDNVAIMHGGTPNFFADLFALWQLGACAACLNPSLTESEISSLVDYLGAKAILADEKSASTGSISATPVLCTATTSPATCVPISSVAQDGDKTALILFTSGTTGTPKGVMQSFRSLERRIALNRAHASDDRLRHSLCVLPTHFGHGLIGNCLTPLFAGGDLYLYPNLDVRTASKLGSILSDNEISFMSSVPTLWRMAIKLSKPPSAASLRRIHVGSAPLSASLWQQIMDWSGTNDVVNMYGITETANWLAGASGIDFAPQDGLVGHMWGGRAAVVSDDGQLRPHGSGEIAVQTPGLMKGYFKRPDLTQQVVKDGWYYTGDIGEIDATGAMVLNGRIRSEINKAGIKVLPEEIDLLLEGHPDVAEACAFAVPDKVSGELVGIAIQAGPERAPTKEQLRAWCRDRIKAESVPDKWFFLENVPKTDRGKVDREAVKRLCLENGGST